MGLHVVLVRPEIPQNAGNIMRTCVATATMLHFIGPLGFKLDPKHLARYGANVIEGAVWDHHDDLETFMATHPGTYVYFTRYGSRSPDQFDFTADVETFLVFGNESTGLPKALLMAHRDACVRLPMTAAVRSLNLANTVAVGLYEALRQRGYPGLSATEPESLRGADWLDRA